MAQEKTFDRADLLRFFHETDHDALVGRLVVIHPLPPTQLAFDQDFAVGETRRYPVMAETTALYCERYNISIVLQTVSYPDGGDMYLPDDHPLREATRRVTTRYGGTSAQLGRWATELADAYRREVADLLPASPIDLVARLNARQDDHGPLHANVRCILPEPEPEPEDERKAEEPEPEPDPDHNATGETMDDFLSGLDSADGEEG